MGLTISYTLSTKRKLAEDVVRQLADRTAAFARKIGCAEVCGPDPGGPELIQLRKLPNGDTTGDFFPAESGWCVMVVPGEGCAPAHFGLCRYSGSRTWKLTNWCKTQHAARHGWEHFLTCHRRVISLLDLWRDFSVDVKVSDEGEFWETRSVERLKERLGAYDRLVAAVAGALKDEFGEGGPSVRAQIFDDGRFERLEAEGRAELRQRSKRCRSCFPKTGSRTTGKNEHESARLDSGNTLIGHWLPVGPKPSNRRAAGAGLGQ